MAFDYSINQCRDVWLSIYGTPAFKTVTGKFISFDKEKQIDYDISENRNIVIEGLANFRVNEYIKEIDNVVDMAVNKYIIEKESINS